MSVLSVPSSSVDTILYDSIGRRRSRQSDVPRKTTNRTIYENFVTETKVSCFHQLVSDVINYVKIDLSTYVYLKLYVTVLSPLTEKK